MKLAEALKSKSHLITQLEYDSRIIRKSCQKQQNSPTQFDPNTLFNQQQGNIDQILYLTKRIEKTNRIIHVECKDESLTMLKALAERENIIRKLNLVQSIVQDGIIPNYSIDIAKKSTIDIHKYENNRRQLANELMQLDMKIQEANWKFDLID